ncbi:hypothetical protein [Isoptericola croceus]|nr:hypothetical protein [Isoptericola croceus]
MRPPIPDHHHLDAHQVAAPPPHDVYEEPRRRAARRGPTAATP